ncbi:MAG: amidohydrolase [Bacteroidales bacterium]|nr:amidohydrolase [Bacteroidales bacterium]
MISVDKIKQLAFETAFLLKEIREHLHQHPELSFNEVETAKYISQWLEKWGIEHKNNIGGNGIVAWIKGREKGKNIAFRADIDALPIDEKNEVPYGSVNKGIMHACGHDLHTASLLGALYLLQSLRNEFNGTIWGIFQPAEEKLPGGAKAMLSDAFFNELYFDAVIAQHVFPDLPAGEVGIRAGQYMASTDELYITIKGRGGHAATPHQITDTVLIASHIIVSLQQIVSRKALPTIPTVLSFGKLIANGATNIIPNEVYMEGTFRTFDENWRKQALQLIEKITKETAQTFGAEAIVHIKNGYPALINNDVLANKILLLAKTYLGDENVKWLDMRMTAEDFAYFAQQYPAAMFRLGTGGTNTTSFPLHSPQFNINEDVYKFSHGLLVWMAIQLLND